jgi:hypothetical protein
VQCEFGIDIVKHDLNPLTNFGLAAGETDQTGDQPRAFIEFDLHNIVWNVVPERRKPRLVDDGPTGDAALAGGPLPGDAIRKAVRAHGPGRQMRLATSRASWKHEHMAATPLPKRRIVRADPWTRSIGTAHWRSAPAVSITESPQTVPH